ncbi:MAG: transketolase family protein [Spirochaetales bacterium]|jgi:transketolase|nr:transketolase family protein [Spirochaetales bacterium]
MSINLNTKSLREAYGLALVELGKKDKNVVALEADLGNSTRSVLFRAEFPDRHFEMGIAEQNMASTSAGLALAGKIPFMSTFAVFASGRAFDQLRNSICIPKLKVRVCGSSAGLSDFGDGKTHQSVEDIAIMRALPNMTVLAPVDAVEVVKMMERINEIDGPVYIRINRNDLPTLTPEAGDWTPGKLWTVREGSDAVVFASGVMASKALEAAQVLSGEGISVRVINASTIKPMNASAVIQAASGVKGIVTAEESNISGGFGSAILEVLRAERHGPVEFVGIQDCFGVSAKNYDELLERYGLTAYAIAQAVRKVVKAAGGVAGA